MRIERHQRRLHIISSSTLDQMSTLCSDSDKMYIFPRKVCSRRPKNRHNRAKSSNGLCSRLSSRGPHAYSGTDEGGATCFRITNSGY